jgi:hypothetical protein
MAEFILYDVKSQPFMILMTLVQESGGRKVGQ